MNKRERGREGKGNFDLIFFFSKEREGEKKTKNSLILFSSITTIDERRVRKRRERVMGD